MCHHMEGIIQSAEKEMIKLVRALEDYSCFDYKSTTMGLKRNHIYVVDKTGPDMYYVRLNNKMTFGFFHYRFEEVQTVGNVYNISSYECKQLRKMLQFK